MFRIFRTLRKKFIVSHNVKSYLLYALGEVFLVVLGILIALQLNNWNDKRIERQKFEDQLLSVQRELTYNIKAISYIYRENTILDSLSNMVLSDTLTAADYQQAGRRLPELILHTSILRLKTNAYERLITDFNEIPEAYEPIVSDLKNLNGVINENIILTNNALLELVFDEIDFLKKNFPSFRYIRQIKKNDSEKYDDEFIQYLLHNPIYKNKVADYQHFVRDNLSTIALMYQFMALEINKEIAAKLEKKLPDVLVPANFYKSVSPQILKNYAGIYQTDKEETIKFIFADDNLYKQEGGSNILLKAFSNNRFLIPEENIEVSFDNTGKYVRFVRNTSILKTYNRYDQRN